MRLIFHLRYFSKSKLHGICHTSLSLSLSLSLQLMYFLSYIVSITLIFLPLWNYHFVVLDVCMVLCVYCTHLCHMKFHLQSGAITCLILRRPTCLVNAQRLLQLRSFAIKIRNILCSFFLLLRVRHIRTRFLGKLMEAVTKYDSFII